jgi:hypothetical protein
MPLAKTFFSPKFGMVTDRFGVAWMVSFRMNRNILVNRNQKNLEEGKS